MAAKAKQIATSGSISERALNRAVLARQMLLAREQVGVEEAIQRLAGQQAQYSPSPYIGLWARLQNFKQDDLTGALKERRVVKATLMRATLHLVTACDYPVFDAALAGGRAATWSRYAAALNLDVPNLRQRLLSYVKEPRTLEEMLAHIGDIPMPPGGEPDPRRRSLIAFRAATAPGGILQALPSGTWRYFGKNSYISARGWLGDYAVPPLDEAITALVRRYLAAFGPASRADVMQWSGLRKVSDVSRAIETLGDQVITFSGDENPGAVFYDLKSAPRPAADTPAPPRFLPKWDNILLAYSSGDRTRVLPKEYHKAVIAVNGDVLPTILVDGKVAGAWQVVRKGKAASLNIEPFTALSGAVRNDLEREGSSLVRFCEPDAAEYSISISGIKQF